MSNVELTLAMMTKEKSWPTLSITANFDTDYIWTCFKERLSDVIGNA
jgi:hypothetical protein